MGIQRTKSRNLTLQILYQNEFHEIPSENQIQTLVDRFFNQQEIISQEELNYSTEILKDLYKNKQAIDQLISDYSVNWRIDRISLIDLNIIRISILEILYHPEIPNKVSINEALELSKIYGSDKSTSFINGILNKVLKNYNLQKQTEEKVDENTEEKVGENTEEKVDENTEEKVGENTEEKVDENTEEKMDENTKEKVGENTEEKTDENTKEKTDETTKEKVDETTKEKTGENTEEKVDENTEEKVDENTEEKVGENTEEKVEKT